MIIDTSLLPEYGSNSKEELIEFLFFLKNNNWFNYSQNVVYEMYIDSIKQYKGLIHSFNEHPSNKPEIFVYHHIIDKFAPLNGMISLLYTIFD